MDKLSIRNLILVIILVVCLAAAIYFGFIYNNAPEQQPAPSETTQETEDQQSIKTNTEKYYHRPVLIAANGSIEYGSGANAWRGMCEYLGTPDISDAYYLCEDTKESILAAIDALEAPSSVVPNLIFLTGTSAGEAVAEAQSTYAGTYFVLLEDTVDAPAPNTCCVTFAAEQAGFLAGYSCVMEGFTRIRFAAEEENAQTLEYYHGFLQGVDHAANEISSGVAVTSCFTLDAAHAVRDGNPQITFVCGSSSFQQAAVDIAKNAQTKIICSGFDYGYLFPGNLAETSPICASVLNNYGAVCVSILTAFDNGGVGEGWSQFYSGKTLRYGLLLGETLSMSATASSWHFKNYNVSQYYHILGSLRSGTLTVSTEETLCGAWVTVSSIDPVAEETE